MLIEFLEPRALVDFDWLRAAPPHDVGQNETAKIEVPLPAIADPGCYEVVFDLVIEGVSKVERSAI